MVEYEAYPYRSGMAHGFDKRPGGATLVHDAAARDRAALSAPGKRTLTEQLVAVPLHAATDEPAGVRAAAERGTAGSGSSLPHLDAIQRSFGRHDVSHVQAHIGGAAAEGARGMGAEAFATGNQVAFASAPSLHTAAHEAAHTIQQAGGVQLSGGVGQDGDEHERHADAVADLVVQGRSSEALLDRYAGSPSAGTQRRPSGSVQRLVAVAGGKISAASIDGVKDPTVLTSIDYALTRTTGPVVLLRDADFSQVKNGETIFITGHGSQGSVTGMTGEAIGKLMTEGPKALRPDLQDVTVFFLSCYASADQLKPGTGGKENEDNSSVIAQLSARLATHLPGVRVIGGTGPTVKSNATGDQFNVIKDPSGTEGVKKTLNATPELENDTLQEQYMNWLKAERVRRREQELQPEEPPIEQRAAKAAEIYHARAIRYLELNKERQLFYDTEDPDERRRMLRMYLDGQEVPYDDGVEAYIQKVLAMRSH